MRPLPHKDGDRLVYLRHSINGPGGENVNFSVPEINDFRESAKSLAGIAEYSGMIYTSQGKQDAVRMNVGLVTGNYFKVMGLSAVAGRLLTDGDDGVNVPPVMVLTHEYWMKRFGGDRERHRPARQARRQVGANRRRRAGRRRTSRARWMRCSTWSSASTTRAR